MVNNTFWDQMASVSLAELHDMRRRLANEFKLHMEQLEAAEVQKTDLDRQGVEQRSLRWQQALARRVADLDQQAELEARLLRLINKQQRLLDRLIWARESLERWEALRAAVPAAVELGWDDLVGAASDLVGAEAKLNTLLLILGVPEEEWPQAPQPTSQAPAAPSRDPDDPVLVNEVLDGRTIRLETGETVRYIGVDAPLLRGRLSQADPGAHEAWQANRRLVEGRYVRLESDVRDRDADGALWRYVWLGKTCANAELIRQGWAYHQPQSPDYRHFDWFARLEKQARRKKRGLWE